MTDDDLKRLLDDTVTRLSAENRHFFATTAEGLLHQVQLVAEAVVGTRDVLARETAETRDEMRRGFGETQAMIKFSHAELDRRVEAVASSTH